MSQSGFSKRGKGRSADLPGPGLKIAAIIAAGGTGTRMSSTLPKQFLKIAGKPILLHTVERLISLENVIQIVIALPSRHVAAARSMLRGKAWRVPVRCVRGGASRQESVRRGVAHIRSHVDLILVHDAVRPLCDRPTMQRVVSAARELGGAVPALPATETIQRVSRRGRILATPPREELYAIQTPQGFHARILKSSLERAHLEGFAGTDESSVVRWAGHHVGIVPGSPQNIKITHPIDLEIAELLMAELLMAELLMKGEAEESLAPDSGRAAKSSIRIGHGIDYHRLATGRRLILGGVEIPFEKGLLGHSDADVLLHAICDALLGAAALGDIGRHFPDSDESHRNRSSLEFLSSVHRKVAAAGWKIVNMDATLLAQGPRLSPYMETMKKNIARSIGLPASEISIKATTTEGMNAEGLGEGISAHAVALLERK
jgi:2-C-methyl-D-erythritol 4-phosphate cytidylyltransferase/2-C-methyl-D-erythritol 2,4-cyclodiphosphate synthase